MFDRRSAQLPRMSAVADAEAAVPLSSSDVLEDIRRARFRYNELLAERLEDRQLLRSAQEVQ